MNEKGEKRKRDSRSKVCLLLTEAEARRLTSALTQMPYLSRSLIILEAIRAGLQNTNLALVQERRSFRINARVPTEFKDRVKRLAGINGFTQQRLLRHFLFQYLTSAPWRETRPLNQQEASSDPQEAGQR